MKHLLFLFFGFLWSLYAVTTHAESIRPLDQLIQWELSDESPFSGSNGYTPWQSFNGGKARFVSCTAGIPQNAVLLTALQIVPNAETLIQKPTLTTNFEAKETKILYPIDNPFSINTNQPYPNDILFFPIIFHLKTTNNAIDIPLNASITTLTPTGYQTSSLSFSLHLKPDSTLSTPICAALMDTLQRVPQPADTHLTGSLVKIDDHTIALTLSFDFIPTRVFAQLDGSAHLLLTQTRLKDKTAFLQFQTDISFPTDTPLTFNIITDKGWFTLPLLMQSNTSASTGKTAFPLSWLSLIALFLFSPFWITLAYLPKKEIRRVALTLLGTGFSTFFALHLILIQTHPNALIYPTAIQSLLAFLLLFFFLKTARSAFLSLPLLIILITPFPLLIPTWLALAQNPVWQAPCLALIGLALCLPLGLVLLKPLLHQRLVLLQESFFLRLPLSLLSVWLILLLILIPMNSRLPLYQKPAPSGYSLIVYNHPTAFSSFWQNLLHFPLNPYKNWENQKMLTLYRGTFPYPPAPINASFPTYVLTDNSGMSRLTIEQPLSNDQLITYLKNFMREPLHPAPNKPTYPPAHSPLRPHDL